MIEHGIRIRRRHVESEEELLKLMKIIASHLPGGFSVKQMAEFCEAFTYPEDWAALAILMELKDDPRFVIDGKYVSLAK